MTTETLGLHHVTAIARDAQANVDFYSQLLGLRLVKLTVNFDDPGSYHLYYGDAEGTPGTNLTFFPHPDGYQGVPGAGQATAIGLAIPHGALDYWIDRLAAENVPFEAPAYRFGEQFITVADPDGLHLELFETDQADGGKPWTGAGVPIDFAIRGMHSVTLAQRDLSTTAPIVQDLGYEVEDTDDDRVRYCVGEGGIGSRLEILHGVQERGRVAVGSIHHVAFRLADDESQQYWLNKVLDEGYHSTPVVNRDYFKSVYFREPGHVLFELATDGPGFAIDEPLEALGTSLQLPEMYEAQRELIVKRLPPLRLPGVVAR